MTDADSRILDRSLPDSARTVLLAGPPTGRLRALCRSLRPTDGTTDVVFVTYTREPSDCLAQISASAVGDVVVITVGDTAPTAQEGVTTRHVDAPADLTRLGIEIGEILDERERVSICFDSVTTVLQYATYADVYEFMHAITARVRAADARIQVHINPVAHDRQVCEGLTTLFDAHVDALGEELSVRTRPAPGPDA